MSPLTDKLISEFEEKFEFNKLLQQDVDRNIYEVNDIVKYLLSSALDTVEQGVKLDLVKKIKREDYNIGLKAGRQSVMSVMREVLGERGIEWMQEGHNKDRKGYTNGYNTLYDKLNSKLDELEALLAQEELTPKE